MSDKNENESTSLANVETDAQIMSVLSKPSEHKAGSEDEIVTSGRQVGTIDLSVPDMAPTDNATREVEVEVVRIKMPVRINNVYITTHANGYEVKLPAAGRHSIFGPGGSSRVFTDKAAMLAFVAQVIGQVAYVYEEKMIDPSNGEEIFS